MSAGECEAGARLDQKAKHSLLVSTHAKLHLVRLLLWSVRLTHRKNFSESAARGVLRHRQRLMEGVQIGGGTRKGPQSNRHIHWFIGRSEMSFVARRLAAFSTAMILLAASQGSAFAQKKYDTGATDTEIKIGNIMPYSG